MCPELLCNTVGGMIACTQPRVNAVWSISRAKAEQWGRRVGGSIGFHGGLRCWVSSHSSLIYITTGTLVLKADPLRREYNGIVLDECHERDEDF